MECKICHNILSEDAERCQNCGAKVVQSNYGNGQGVTNVIRVSSNLDVLQNQEGLQPNNNNNMSTITNNVISQNNNIQANINNTQEELKPASEGMIHPSTPINTPVQPVAPATQQSVNTQATNQKVGAPLPVTNNTLNNNLKSNTTTIKNNDSIEEELAEYYLGEKYQIFKKKKFSFATFFFGGFYMCYRKQYVNAVVLFAASYLSLFLFNVTNSIFIALLFLIAYIFYAIRFPKMYLQVVNKKIKKDIEQFNGSNYDTLKIQLLRESSTSPLAMVVALIAFFIIGVITSIAMLVKGIGQIFSDTKIISETTLSPENSNENKKIIGNKNHGYIKITENFDQEISISPDFLAYTSWDGTVTVEFEISSSASVEEATGVKQDSLSGSTLSVPNKDAWIISNKDGNINSSILVKQMKDGKIHIITVSTSTEQTDCFDMLDTYYM